MGDPLADVGADRLFGHIELRKRRVGFLAFCRCLRSLHPPEACLHFVLDNFGPRKATVRRWAAGKNVELAHSPHYASWLNGTSECGEAVASSG